MLQFTIMSYYVLTQQDLLVHNVLSLKRLVLILCILLYRKPQVARSTHPGAGHLQLTMAEYLTSEPDTNILQRLPLRLVDGSREGNSDRKLSTLPLEWEVPCLRNEGDARNEDHSL